MLFAQHVYIVLPPSPDICQVAPLYYYFLQLGGSTCCLVTISGKRVLGHARPPGYLAHAVVSPPCAPNQLTLVKPPAVGTQSRVDSNGRRRIHDPTTLLTLQG
ncbi:hypothetical protein ACJBU6_09072 [Exserohilum turcicum]